MLYNKPLSDRTLGLHADLSPTRSTLYIVSPCYRDRWMLGDYWSTTGRAAHITGSMDVFGDSRWVQRRRPDLHATTPPQGPSDGPPMVYYPYIHARPDGSQIAFISDEAVALNGGRNASAPILRAYLRSVDGRIFVQGEWVP